MHITEKGQVTIPVTIREKYGFLPHTEVEFEVQGDMIVLKKAPARSSRKRLSRGESLVKHLRSFGPLSMTTEEIMRLTRGED